MNKPLERNMSYDLIRSVAILLVIGIHCLEGISYYPILMNQVVVSTPSWIVQSLFYVVGRMGVPLFLMLTGALMLKRELVLDKSYMCTKVLPLYIPTVIWTFIYFLAATIKASDVPTPKSMIAFFVRAIFLDTASSPHLWYMSAIIGLYLFLPLLSHIVKYCSEKTLLNSLLVAGILAMVLPTFNLFIHINGFGETVDFSVSSVRNRSLILPLYAIMLMMGYLLEEKRLIKM